MEDQSCGRCKIMKTIIEKIAHLFICDTLALSVAAAGLGNNATVFTTTDSWNNGKEVPRWGVAEIQKMSPPTTGRCYCCH